MWRHLCSLSAWARGADPRSEHEGKTRSWQGLHAQATAVAPRSKRSTTRCYDLSDITRCTTVEGLRRSATQNHARGETNAKCPGEGRGKGERRGEKGGRRGGGKASWGEGGNTRPEDGMLEEGRGGGEG